MNVITRESVVYRYNDVLPYIIRRRTYEENDGRYCLRLIIFALLSYIYIYIGVVGRVTGSVALKNCLTRRASRRNKHRVFEVATNILRKR